MRLNSSGELLIGTTSSNSSRLLVVGGTNTFYAQGNTSTSFGATITAVNSSATQLLLIRNDGLISTGTAGLSPYNFTTGTAANLVVDNSGYLYRSTSSLKYKTNVRDYDKGLDIINQMRPVYYNGKNDGNTQFAGLIAEEVHALGLTEFVQYANDGSPDALSYPNMVALLVKGIKELKAELDLIKNK
jgi:hypothetical protein